MKLRWLLAALMLAAPSLAQTPSPRALYIAGHYNAAIRAGLAQHDGEGLTEAARAALANARLGKGPCLSCLKLAESYARAAIAADPTSALARVYLAASLGYEARIIGIMEAEAKGFAGEAKDNLKIALKYHPHNGFALAAMGGWNIGVVAGGGSVLADLMYGASTSDGIAYYHKAFAADPSSIVPRFEYVLSLSSLDRARYAGQIEKALNFVVQGTPHTAYEKVMQEQGRQLLALWQAKNWSAYQRLVHHIQGYPD